MNCKEQNATSFNLTFKLLLVRSQKQSSQNDSLIRKKCFLSSGVHKDASKIKQNLI